MPFESPHFLLPTIPFATAIIVHLYPPLRISILLFPRQDTPFPTEAEHHCPIAKYLCNEILVEKKMGDYVNGDTTILFLSLIFLTLIPILLTWVIGTLKGVLHGKVNIFDFGKMIDH